MSFNRLAPEDFVVSSDSITSTLWTGGLTSLTTFNTSSTQEAGSSGNFYLNIYQTASTNPLAEVQFAIAYGNQAGSGSSWYNASVPGMSPTKTTYGQYQVLVLGDENSGFVFGGISSSDFWVLSIDRTRYKQSILPGSMALVLSGSTGKITLTDDSQVASSVIFNDAGRIFQLVSGSQGTVNTTNPNGYSSTQGSYGWLLPDIGTIILNPVALAEPQISGGIAFNYSGSATVPGTGSANPIITPMSSLYRAISGSGARSFTINSQETITSDYIFIRPRSSEFNYSENPSFISGSTGEVLYSNFINSPQVYITTVGLYNDTNELLAVAKLSRPLVKDFTKEALIRVKLDF